MARPRLNIDLDQVEKLAAIHCTNTEIAAIVGCEASLLSKPRFSGIIQKGRERGKLTLRRKMFETAMAGNVTMQIWLSKQLLGMKEPKQSLEHSQDPDNPITSQVVILPDNGRTPIKDSTPARSPNRISKDQG